MSGKLPRLASLALAVGLLASGCSTPPTPPPQPTPVLIHVQHTPALAAWSERLSECAESIPGTALLVEERPAAALDVAEADLALRFGPAPEASPLASQYAAVLAEDELVLVVNTENKAERLSLEEAAGLFTGELTNWQDVGEADEAAQVWVYPVGDDLRQVFEKAVLGGSAPTPRAFIAPDPPAMLEAVQENPGAVGYMLKSQVTGEVRILPIVGSPEALKQPVLAYSKAEPTGSLRELLVCLQTP